MDGNLMGMSHNRRLRIRLKSALERSKIIESRETCKFERCGRTDKGVSAFRQVVALNVRSIDTKAEGIWWPEDSEPADRTKSGDEELNYVRILNSNLPTSIRMLAWAPLKTQHFSPRFHCKDRTYKYFMPSPDLDIAAMKQAANLIEGTHDFRNFCKIDHNPARLKMSYVRNIYEVTVEPIETPSNSQGNSSTAYNLLELTIRGSGFLWHQIRCIAALLYDIGLRNEQPELITELFDIEKFPGRPIYDYAAETPLCLFDCNFSDDYSLNWKYDYDTLKGTIGNLQMAWAEYQTKATMIRRMIDDLNPKLSELQPPEIAPKLYLHGIHKFVYGKETNYSLLKPKPHAPILKRRRCDSLEERRKKSARIVEDAEKSSSNSHMEDD